ncbi:MAG: NADH-quinone oxidoreductase subunit N [Anaerolineae bacterium]|nr:NADH-quinone oxidoreductase subunit N [Anaerolineae bacterium]
MQVPSIAELNLGAALPAVLLALGACVLLVVDLFLPKNRKDWTAWLMLGGLVVSFVVNLFNYNNQSTALAGMFVSDQFTAFLNITILVAAFIAGLLSIDYLKRAGIAKGEYYVLMLFSVCGAMFMSSANDLIVVFIALELLSIPLYIMAAFRPNNAKSEESGMKYFILGAFASAFLVYGAALIYGATGTTSLPGIFQAVEGIVAAETASRYYLLVGTALLIVGLGFKVAVVPFHMWTPDVYEGAPTPVTAYMSVGAKIGGFAALIRIMIVALPTLTSQAGEITAAWQNVLMLIAGATLILGNFVAVAQSNMKRMLAYSSIAHAGYILMAVAAAGSPGVGNQAAQGALVYLLAYTFTNMGAFAVVLTLEKADGSGTEIEDYVGLGKNRPLLAAAMVVFLFSLAGLPPTAGFWGKWLVFKPTLDAGLVPLAIIGVLTSVVSAYYYVRIIVNMYLRDKETTETPGETTLVNWAIYGSFAGTLILGLLPFLATNLANTINLANFIPQ